MEEKRNSVGKVLACLLLCSKGGCTIRKLENDYRNEEGHAIPYQEFGCISAIDFFRTIPGHVRLVYEGGQHLVYPVVSEKTRHVKDLVARQRPPKGSSRRKSSRPSKYYPSTSPLRSFVPFQVQRSVAHMLTSNPSGVPRSCVADQLQQSRSIAGTVNVDNVDEFVNGMPHTAVSSGNKIYPSRSLFTRSRSAQRGQEDFGGFDVVSPRKSETENPSEQYATALPAGSEEADDLCEPQTYDGGSRYLSYDVRAKKNAGCSNASTGRMSSAAFIDKAAGLQYTEVARESGNPEGTGPAIEVERYVEEEKETIDPDCTYVSDDEKSVEIIGSRMKARLENLIKKHPNGIWCADLVEAYSTEYKLRFDFKDYGFSSVSEFASHLKDIFHLVRLNARGDFRLYDAKQPVPQSESRPGPRPVNAEWQDDSDDDNANPLPLQVESKESLRLVPSDVMAYGESVGQVRIPAVSEGPDYSNIEVFVSEVYTPSCFWIHLRKKRAKLEQFMASLHDFYEREGDNYTIPLVVLAKGLNCVCTFQDKWHRAVIKNVKPNGNVTVIFYDYGTTQTYPPESVRYLTRTYSDLPAQAIACGLYNIRPINCETWTMGASTEFYSKVEDLPLIAMVIKVDRENNSMLVSLVDTQGEVDFHINDWMVRQGLAEIGSLGDSVDLEARYYEDQAQPQVQKVVTTQAANVSLVTPQSTPPDSETLRPPPGFTKPSETTNYAAMMDENLRSRNYSYSTTESSNLFNYCNFSVNNHPSAAATTLYNLLSLAPEALVQFWQQQLAAAVNQFLLTNNTASTAMNSTLNTTDVEPPCSIVQEKTSPFQSYQDRELSSNEFDTNNYSNRTTLPQPSEREQNLTNGDSNPLDLDDEILTEAADGDIDELSVRLHDTNPFKQYIIRGDSSPVETNNNILKVPPIPPRNPSSLNKDVNLATTKIPDVNPSPRIYYTGEPVMYKLNDGERKRDEETSKFEEPVSSGGNKTHGIINSSDEITNQSLGGNTLPEIEKKNPFTPVHKVSMNDTQFLSPRISLSNYRPPPPPYNGNCTEIQYRNRTVISPRYPSLLASGDTRALSEDIQLPRLDLFNKIESAAPVNPGLETRSEKFKNLGSFEESASSFSTNNITESFTTPKSSKFCTKNATEPKKEYKIKIIIPKSLQGQKSLDNRTKLLSKTLEITPRFEELQGFSERESKPCMKRQIGPTDDLHSDGSKDSEEPRGHGNPFVQTETQNREKLWESSTVDQRCLAQAEKANSGISYNGGIRKDFDHSGFPTSTRPMRESPIVSPQPYQSQPLYYPPIYHMVPQQIHPVPLPMQFRQQIPRHRPNMSGYFSPLPPWVRPQLYNAAYSQGTAHPSQPPQHPNFWRHNPMFSTQQPAGVSHKAGANEGQQNSKMDVDHSDSTPKLNGSSSHLANGDVARSKIEKRDEEVTSFVEEAKEGKNLSPKESITSSSEESIIDSMNGFTENVPVVEPVKIFKPIEVHKQTIHIFNIDHQGWVSTDEIVQVFLPTETRNIVLRMLRMLNVQIDFLEISRDQSPDLFAQLDDSSIRLPRMTNSQRIRGALHLTPIQLLYRMMMALRVISDQDIERSKKQKPLPGSNLAELVKLVLAYRSDDAYWA